MNKFLLVLFLVFLSGCSVRAYPDLTHYSLEDFLSEKARCDLKSQCKYIGYGIGNGGCASSPIYEGFVVYSIKYGKTNIEYLKNLAAKSRHPFSVNQNQTSSLLMNINYELEECLPVGNLKPIMQCKNNICLKTAGSDT